MCVKCVNITFSHYVENAGLSTMMVSQINFTVVNHYQPEKSDILLNKGSTSFKIKEHTAHLQSKLTPLT